MQTTPIIGQKVTIKNFSETYMVKSVVGDASTVDLLTLTGKPCAVMDVQVSDLSPADADVAEADRSPQRITQIVEE